MKYHLFVLLALLANVSAGDSHLSNSDIDKLEKHRLDLQQALKHVESQIESISRQQTEKINTTTVQPSTTTLSTSTTSGTTPTQSTSTLESSTSTNLETTTAQTSEVQSSKFRRRQDARFHEIFIHNLTNCRTWDREQLIRQLKVYGTYNPDFMAWDVSGVRRFLTKDTVSYDKQEPYHRKYPMFQKNVEALEKMITDLELKDCDVKSTEMRERLHNITADLKDYYEYNNIPAFQRRHKRELHRFERDLIFGEQQTPFGISRSEAVAIARLIREYKMGENLEFAFSHDDDPTPETETKKEEIVGIRHVYECDERGSLHEGYLRMCATCRGIRWMPKTFFPPFINEVLCDQEKSCLYFYDYPHGKCLQKNLNFQILQNIGTDDCQIWQKYNLNVPVCCECFVDHMSFFAKYV